MLAQGQAQESSYPTNTPMLENLLPSPALPPPPTMLGPHIGCCFHPLILHIYLEHSTALPTQPRPLSQLNYSSSSHSQMSLLGETFLTRQDRLEWPGMCFLGSMCFFITLFTIYKYLKSLYSPLFSVYVPHWTAGSTRVGTTPISSSLHAQHIPHGLVQSRD